MTEAFDARQFETVAVDAVSAALPQADLDALRASFDQGIDVTRPTNRGVATDR